MRSEQLAGAELAEQSIGKPTSGTVGIEQPQETLPQLEQIQELPRRTSASQIPGKTGKIWKENIGLLVTNRHRNMSLPTRRILRATNSRRFWISQAWRTSSG